MKKFYFAFLFSLLALLLGSCKKKEPRVLPTLTTTPADSITKNSAISGGTVTNDFEWHAAKGICYSRSPNPLIDIDPISAQAGVYIVDGNVDLKTFTVTLTALGSGATYYAKAFTVGGWINEKPRIWRLVYGNEISFTTTLTR